MTPAELQTVLASARNGLESGRRPYTTAEELFETVITAVSPWRSAGLSREAEEAVVSSVLLLLDCGQKVFLDDRHATRPLNEILRWARHVAGTLDVDPRLSGPLEAAHREWNWRLG